MPDRIAIKVLQKSDLTFFDPFLKKKNSASKQKAINLNADVFAKVFYPDFTKDTLGTDVEVATQVTVFGPLPGDPYRLKRSIGRGESYKNWRLNGETVRNPDNDQGKFDGLAEGDVAVMEFHGAAEPSALTMVIVSAKHDPALRDLLAAETPGGRRTMAAVSRSRLSYIADAAGAAADHPIRSLLEDQELEELVEEALTGVEPAIRTLRARPGRKATKADLEAARLRTDRIGSDGEALAHVLLDQMKRDGKIADVIWTSQGNAVASWDFEIVENSGQRVRLDAKSTNRQFNKSFQLSAAETVAAADASVPYRILRISELGEDGAQGCISTDINALAAQIVKASEQLPPGVLPTGFSLATNTLKWGETIPIARPDEPEPE